MKLDSVRLLVKDFDECFKFYRDVLNLKATWGDVGDAYASFDVGYNNVLAIFKSDLMSEVLGDSDKKLPDNTRNKFLISIRVKNLEKTYEKLKSQGVVFINEPMEMTGWGDYVAHLRDPEGNVIEFCSDLDESKWDEDLLADKEKYR